MHFNRAKINKTLKICMKENIFRIENALFWLLESILY